jgi:hypothetical protein
LLWLTSAAAKVEGVAAVFVEKVKFLNENMQKKLDALMKETGAHFTYFPWLHPSLPLARHS